MAIEVVAPTAAIRDQVGDHLITPKNSALVVIDYQPSQLAGVRSMDRDLLLENVVSTVKIAKVFGLPIVEAVVENRDAVEDDHSDTLLFVQHALAVDDDAPRAWGRQLQKRELPRSGNHDCQ